MKRSIMVLTILALLFPTFAFATHGTWAWFDCYAFGPIVGTYYKGYSYLFIACIRKEEHMRNLEVLRMSMDKYGKLHPQWQVPARGTNAPAVIQPSCCTVFNESIFLFVTEPGRIRYRYLAGTETKDWSPQWYDLKGPGGKDLNKNFCTSWEASVRKWGTVATAVVNGRLYLFGVDKDARLGYVFTNDGLTWSDWYYGGHTDLTYNVWHCNLSACTFTTKDGEERVMIAGRNIENGKIKTVLFDGERFYNIQNSNNRDYYPHGISLVSGSIEGCGSGNMMQVFFLMREPPYFTMHRMEYNIDYNRWSISSETHANWYALEKDTGPFWPGAFSFFKPDGTTNLQKEVWGCVHIIDEKNTLGILRLRSDKLVRVNTASQWCDPTAKSLWTLAGVVEGPPPFVLNGRDLQDIKSPSVFEYGQETSKGAESSHESSHEAFVSFKLPVADFFNVGADYRYAIDQKYDTMTTYTLETIDKITPVAGYSYGYYYYLKPQVQRWDYEVHDHGGIPTGRTEHIFSISEATPDFVEYDMTKVPGSPDPHDITSYLNRTPDPKYPRISEQPMSWSAGRTERFRFAGDTTVSNSETSKHTWKVELHDPFHIFDIGYEGSVAFKQIHTYNCGEHIEVTLACPDPRVDSTKDIRRFEMIAYWLAPDPKTDSAYWIPGGYIEGQRPWCMTWEVTRIEYNDGTVLTAVEEEELAPSLNLDVVSPNPFMAGVMLRYSLPQTGQISFNIYDLSGRLVKTLVSGTEEAGEHSLVWKGTDNQGRMLTQGVYFARLECGSEQRVQKIVMVR